MHYYYTAQLWDPRDGTLVRTLSGHQGEVTGVSYSQDELYLVSCASDQAIFIWDLTVNAVVKILRGHCDIIYGYVFFFHSYHIL
jgi:WD40 repeat protein